MKLHHILLAAILAGAAVHAADTKAPASGAAAAFEHLKSLAGEWQAADKSRLTYELTGGGTAVVEKFTSESMPAMHTVYHLDGDRLLLTHYCIAGNQPRMVAGPFDSKTGEVEFKFLDATNLAKPGAGHMHGVRMRFVDSNRLETHWQFFENGQPKFTEDVTYSRVR